MTAIVSNKDNSLPVGISSGYSLPKAIASKKADSTLAISKAAKAAFANLVKALTFPTRYLGSKTWSIPGAISRTPGALFKRLLHKDKGTSLSQAIFGPSDHYRTILEPLSPQATVPYLPYVFALISGHIANFKITKPFGFQLLEPEALKLPAHSLPGHLTLKPHCFFDPDSGLKVTIFAKNENIIIAFGGLGSYDVEIFGEDKAKITRRKMIRTVMKNGLGLKPQLYADADKLLCAILKSGCMQDKKIVLTGQCFGGAIASYLGIKHQMSTVCFNSVPLGAGLQHEIGDEKLLQAHQYITHLSVKDDYMSNLRGIGIPDRLLSLIGIRTPGNFGRRYEIPSAFKDHIKTHAYVSGSMMKHLGYAPKTYPCDLSPEDPILKGYTSMV